MLKDLNQLTIEAQARRVAYDNAEIKLSGRFKELFERSFPDMQIRFFDYTAEYISPEELFVIIPNQWFVISSYFVELFNELIRYKEIVRSMSLQNTEISEMRSTRTLTGDVADKIDGLDLSALEKEYVGKFLTDYTWWSGYKTIDRSDFFVSTILNLSKSVHVSQGHIPSLTVLMSDKPDLVSLLFEAGEDALSNNAPKADTPVDLKGRFASWLQTVSRNNYFDNNLERILKGLDRYEEEYNREFADQLFDVDFSDLENKIRIIDSNISDKTTNFYAYSESKSNHQPKAILGKGNYFKFLREFKQSRGDTSGSALGNGYNKIYFGAPGTGKSYKVAEKLKEQMVPEGNIERVTFHPDYDYSSFVGGYKPVTEIGEDGLENIRYKFVPQVFTNIYERAWRDSGQNYYLIIEEINRGNCAEIFGDVFQLLDRNPDYAITPSEDLLKYLQKRDLDAPGESLRSGKMTMPDNLVILATMNTSDQSLYPMDSAFKRRWDWEYVPVKYPTDEADQSCPSFAYRIDLDADHYISWMEMVRTINHQILQNPSLGMDKCLGNFFVKADHGNLISAAAVINKVMFYLWNDVFKDEENEIFADHSYNDYFPVETVGRARLRALADRYELTRARETSPDLEATAAVEVETGS